MNKFNGNIYNIDPWKQWTNTAKMEFRSNMKKLWNNRTEIQRKMNKMNNYIKGTSTPSNCTTGLLRVQTLPGLQNPGHTPPFCPFSFSCACPDQIWPPHNVPKSFDEFWIGSNYCFSPTEEVAHLFMLATFPQLFTTVILFRIAPVLPT